MAHIVPQGWFRAAASPVPWDFAGHCSKGDLDKAGGWGCDLQPGGLGEMVGNTQKNHGLISWGSHIVNGVYNSGE